MIRKHGLGYVMQVAANRRVPTGASPVRVDQLPALIPPGAWQRYSAGAGSKGQRYYSWAWIAIQPEPGGTAEAGQHHVLIRRNDATIELAYHRCYSPKPVPLLTLVKVAGQRWRIEESFQAAKTLTGLDQHRSAVGPPGTAGPPLLCSPTHSSPSPPPPNDARPQARKA